MNAALQRHDHAARVDFVVELAGRLHAYGTTAHRLEGAVTAVATRLGLECGAWSNPTGMILSFGEAGVGRRDTVRVVRLSPGETDLYKLGEADRIAEAVMNGKLDLEAGHEALRALDRPGSWRGRAMAVFAFGLSAAAVAGLWRLPWLDIATAGATGLLLGGLDWATQNRPRLKEASDAIAAMFAGAIAVLVASFVGPLNLNTVIISSLIVLMPGMALTNAVNELTNQNLVSGTARFAGAMSTILKLAIGMLVALNAAEMIGLHPDVRPLRPQPDWVEWVALLLGTYAFAVLFRAHRRDYPLVMLAAASGYLISRFVGGEWGSTVGVFVAALAMTAAGNAYSRWFNRPGALVRLPGIIMLVPGSASLRGLLAVVQEQSMEAGQAAMLAALNILLALIAGLLFGNILIPTRRNL
ncbi:MAG: threonine/serine ThrE exporter family protein [Pseudomonadota bacterium]